MTTKHTKWETGDQNRSIFEANNGYLIAFVHNQNEANARLIASAPELLSVLESLLTDICEDINPIHFTSSVNQSINDATAALKAAKGE